MNAKINIIVILADLLLLAGCRNKSNKEENKDDNFVDYPVVILPDTLHASVSDQYTLYPLSEDFMDRFFEKAQTYIGSHVQAKAEFPTEWGVRCKERLPEGRELWLLQSQSREWMYLVITSGFGTQRILDLMPVAVNVAIQKQDVLETELWNAYRQADGNTFTITKEYEWIKSLTKATKQGFMEDPEKYHRKSIVSEQFVINASGRFEMVEIADTLPDYDAVIFFYNRNEKPEMWDECIPRLQAFCEENHVLYEEVYQNYQQITVRDYDMTSQFDCDITPYINGISCGMVMFKKGESPKSVNFGSFEYMQMCMRRYFRISNPAVL